MDGMSIDGSGVSWPQIFQPWPTGDDITDDDRKLWLMQNRDFKQWASSIASKPSTWADLELLIRTVLGKGSSSVWSKASKMACNEYWAESEATKEARDKTKHIISYAGLREIGKKTAIYTLAELSIPWKTDLSEWTRKAFITLAPRLHMLAMKAKNKEDVKAKKLEKSDILNIDNDAHSTASTATTASARTLENQSKRGPSQKSAVARLSGSENSLKRQKRTGVLKRVIFESEELQLSHKAPTPSQNLLCYKSITIDVDDSIIGSKVPFVIVSISTILNDNTEDLQDVNIRYQHLSWLKFIRILEETDAMCSINLGSGRKLVYATEDEREGQRGSILEIKDKEGFRRAVGVLDWKVLQNTDLPLSLPMRLVASTH